MKSETLVTLVLLPGLDGTGLLYQQLAMQFGVDHKLQVIAYPLDQLSGYQELLDFIRPQLPQSSYVLLAESFSGPLGILLAAEQPAHLKALVLCCSFGRNPLPAAQALMPAVDHLPWSPQVQQWACFWLQERYASPDLSALLQQALSLVPEQLIKHRIKQVLQVDVLREFSTLNVPLLYLQARHDRLIWTFNAKNLLQLQPAMQLEVLDAPHFLLQTIPAVAAERIKHFIANSLQATPV